MNKFGNQSTARIIIKLKRKHIAVIITQVTNSLGPWSTPDLWLTCDRFVGKVSAIGRLNQANSACHPFSYSLRFVPLKYVGGFNLFSTKKWNYKPKNVLRNTDRWVLQFAVLVYIMHAYNYQQIINVQLIHTAGNSHTYVPPLGNVHWLDDPRNFVHKGDGSRDVVQNSDITYLLPRHRHVLHQFQNSMRHVLQSSEYHS